MAKKVTAMNTFAGSLILVVDDDPMFRLMLRQFLERHSFQICEASNGVEAIEKYMAESPKMILMDANMPVMSGFDACKRIREIDPQESCPVLIITALDDDGFISEAFAAGASDYVSKPIHWTVLKQRILHKLKASRDAHALHASEERFRMLYQQSPLPYQSLDSQGFILEVNPAWLAMLGYNANQVIGKPFANFLSADDQQKFLQNFPKFKACGHASNVHFHILNSDRRQIDIELNGRIGYDLNGDFKQTHCVLQDISKRQAMEDTLRKLASTDPLTGLANRRSFFEQAEHARLHCIRYQHPYSIMMLDIDHFKSINDTFGHDIGDDVLKLVSDIMAQSLREVDILGRLGGEEFAIVLPETPLSHALAVAERIRASIDVFKMETDRGNVDVKISIGVTLLSTHKESNERLLKEADLLLYKAKQNGRNRIEQGIQR